MITNHALIKLTQQLIHQPSIGPNNHSCQTIIMHFLKKLNFNIEEICCNSTHNIWSYHENKYKKNKKNGNTLLFLGHTDVVSPGNLKHWNYPPFLGTIHNNMLYGRGAADMKGALAAMLIAAKNFIERYPNHQNRIAFIITSDEEGTGKDGTIKVTESLMQRNERIDYCIVGEPSSFLQLGDIVKNGRRGSLNGKLTIYGSQGHVAYPKFLKNPIHSAVPILQNILNNTKWDQEKNTLHPPTTLQITNIYAKNNNNNMTPYEIILNYNFRFNNLSSINNIQRYINDILVYHKLNFQIDWKLSAEPYFSKPGKLSKIVNNAVFHYQKIIPQLETTGGTSDGRFIAKMGSEVLELGALNRTIHKPNECINLSDLILLSKIYQKIIEETLLYNI